MSRRVQVTVSIDEKKVTLEGPEDFVRQEVERLVQLTARDASRTQANTQGSGATEASKLSDRELVEQKRPSGHSEIVAVLAYGLRERGTIEFRDDDMRRAYIRAGVRPPKVVAQALRDAKNKFDFLESGKGRGTYRLSPHGERKVLFDLPAKKTEAWQ